MRSFVPSSRVCEAGLHLCTDLFLQVLTQAEESGAPPIKRVRSETLTSMKGRHCLGKRMSLNSTKLNLFSGLKFRPVDLLKDRTVTLMSLIGMYLNV